MKNGVHETTEYLELFLRNLLLDEKNELHNRSMSRTSGRFKETDIVQILHEAKHHVNVRLDMDEMDLTAAELKVQGTFAQRGPGSVDRLLMRR